MQPRSRWKWKHGWNLFACITPIYTLIRDLMNSDRGWYPMQRAFEKDSSQQVYRNYCFIFTSFNSAGFWLPFCGIVQNCCFSWPLCLIHVWYTSVVLPRRSKRCKAAIWTNTKPGYGCMLQIFEQHIVWKITRVWSFEHRIPMWRCCGFRFKRILFAAFWS